jgi:hypothetical protein
MAKGIDIGTCFLVCASQDSQGTVNVKSVRDAFFDVDNEKSVKTMLKMSNVPFIEEEDTLYIIGESALTFANLFQKEARRPLSQGVIAPGERDAEKILYILLNELIGKSTKEDEVVYYSVPAAPIDRDIDVVYHTAMFKKILEQFGYRPQPMNEAAAIVYSNCSKENFTALATSWGSGMLNTALLYKTMVGMSFSSSQAGDWIDKSSAKATNSTSSKMMSIKEQGIDLLDPTKGDPKYIREREALVVYYRNLIHNTIDNIRREFKKTQSSVTLPESIPWVLAGGTSKPENFLQFFQIEFEKVRKNFPINISEIRMANDPLNDVARGLLIAALND